MRLRSVPPIIMVWVLVQLAGTNPILAQTEGEAPAEAPVTDTEAGVDEASDATAAEDETSSEAETEPVAPPATARPTVEDTDQAIRLRGLEERVNDLKEQVFRSKARLLLLRETVLNGVISGARARILHINDVGSAFNLMQLSYALDGAPLYAKQAEDGSLDDQRQIELFNGSIVPGNHNISLFMQFQGNGYGVFSYLRAYKFDVRSSYAFTAEEGRQTTVKAVAYEKGGFTTDIRDRLAVRYDVEVQQNVEEPQAEATSTETP